VSHGTVNQGWLQGLWKGHGNGLALPLVEQRHEEEKLNGGQEGGRRGGSKQAEEEGGGNTEGSS
jgi:hypothetical protein